MKIINSIKNKLVKRLSVELGNQFREDIQNALNNPEIQENLKEMVENQDVELHDEDGAPFLQRHLDKLKVRTQHEDEEDQDRESLNITLESPTLKKLDKAEL